MDLVLDAFDYACGDVNNLYLQGGRDSTAALLS
jgi:hypothetical protein